MQGLPFFRAAAHPASRTTVLLPAEGDPVEVLSRCLGPPHFPLRPDELLGDWRFVALEPWTYQVEGFSVTALEIAHLDSRTYGYRVSDDSGAVACLSDHSPLALRPVRRDSASITPQPGRWWPTSMSSYDSQHLAEEFRAKGVPRALRRGVRNRPGRACAAEAIEAQASMVGPVNAMGARAESRRPSSGQPQKLFTWEEIFFPAPRIAATMVRYLDQLRVSARPATLQASDDALRMFAGHITTVDPKCRSASAIEQRHVEAHKTWMASRPGRRAPKLSPATISHRLCLLRTFFERIIDWDYEDAPRRSPVYGDFPQRNEPLPKFLDDPTAAKFMAALATDPNKGPRGR